MFYKKKGMPEIGDLVICTIKKILHHSIFVYLDEYDRKEGMIHISEVSPGRIRNIRDYVKEGKRVVCKVLDIKKDKGHIDLSLRRVNQSERINKNAEYKQEQKAEKLLEQMGKQLKKDISTMYKEAGFPLINRFGSLYQSFQEIVANEDALKDLQLPKETEKKLTEIIKEKIKIPEVRIEGNLIIECPASNGVEIIRETLTSAQKTKNIEIKYVSAPKYSLSVTAPDYKEAELTLKKVQENIIKKIKESQGTAEFSRAK
tara:strand:+ start:3027 stop:3803 length:777 start_codon:yes stop_codon:yes gene_type:complete